MRRTAVLWEVCMMFANAGNVAMFTGNGNDSFVASGGTAQMVGGAASDLYILVNGGAGGTDTIWNFTPGQDLVALFDYGNIVPALPQSALVAAGSTTISLPDNTRITFGDLAHLTANDLFAG